MIIAEIVNPIITLMRELAQEHVTGFDFTILQFKFNDNIFYGFKINDLIMFVDTSIMDNRTILDYLSAKLLARYGHSLEISNHLAETIYNATKLNDIIAELSHLDAASGYKIRFDGQKSAFYALILNDPMQQMLDAWVQMPFDAMRSSDQAIYHHWITQLRMKQMSHKHH
jgi:hypothetical protein